MKLDTKAFEAKMQKLVTGYEAELETIRVGRANPKVLDKIKVDYWGMPTPVNQVGEVKVADARTIIITPWESNMLKVVEKAINESDLGIPPQNDGKCIRLAFPALTGEKRKEISKEVTTLSMEDNHIEECNEEVLKNLLNTIVSEKNRIHEKETLEENLKNKDPLDQARILADYIKRTKKNKK
jgi:ribosome recycling factor